MRESRRRMWWSDNSNKKGVAARTSAERSSSGESGAGGRKSGGTIIRQLKRLGASCDWVRECFTMDEPRQRAVREAFVRLYEDGLIYRGERLINWCARCRTALSDIEVEHEETKGFLYHIAYPLVDDPSTALIVATTRPETMLGDTAVAVHPEDPRYNRLIGRMVMLPLTGRTHPGRGRLDPGGSGVRDRCRQNHPGARLQ